MNPSISNELTCREIAFGSDLYRETVRLREEVLRRPLGLPWEASAFQAEEMSFHLGCFLGDTLVACMILRPLDEQTLKMRQVAVAPAHQSQGIGSALLQFAEKFALDHGYRKIVANARETAIAFYRRHRYKVVGEMFLEVGIPHFFISKTLDA